MESMSELAVPVILNGVTMAVLNIESQDLDDFTEDDKRLLETLTSHVAFALNRTTDSTGDITGEALRVMKLDYALGRLKEVETISSLIRGQLRDSLRSIKNASGILMDQPDMLTDLVASIDQGADHASKVAEIITDTLETSSKDENYVEINQVVKSVMESIYIPRSIETKLSLQSGLLVSEVDRSKITRVIENLVRNAVEAMSDGGTLEINISRDQQNVKIEIKDTGAGIPPQTLDRLFEPFNSTKQGHVGLGLAFCKSTLESMGGSIEAKTGKTGAIMMITIPLKNM
jgi:signal transduction histidine kinase